MGQLLTGKLSRFCFETELQAEQSFHVDIDGIDRAVAVDGLQQALALVVVDKGARALGVHIEAIANRGLVVVVALIHLAVALRAGGVGSGADVAAFLAAATLGETLDDDFGVNVDEQGGVIDGDKVLAVCGSDMKRRGKLSGGTIVATVMSNLGLHEFCRENGVGLVCTSVGDRNVLEKMNECGYKLGGEQTGHTIFTDYATTGDGQLTALQFLDVLARSGKKASELASVCPQYPQVLLNVAVSHERGVKDAIMASDALSAAIAEEEGKLSGEGRVLVRPSGTEALIRVMVEAKTEQIALLAAENLVNVIKML